MQITIHHGGATRTVDQADWEATVDAMIAELGPWDPDKGSRVERENSGFHTDLVVDDQAKQRIEAQQDALREQGMDVGREHQLYDSGTRMADVGYANQLHRAAEHAAKRDLRDVAHELAGRIFAEKREDVDCTVKDLMGTFTMNGVIRADGFQLRDQAVRGLLGRMESPALRYVTGLQERIREGRVQLDALKLAGEAAARATLAQLIELDKNALVDVLERECKRHQDVEIKMRLRHGLKDCFAMTSHTYGVADAPQVIAEILDGLPADAKGSYSYHPDSTRWELRGHVWTPIPVDEQAVGEAFEAFSSFKGVDNGTGTVDGGGGVSLLACLNAATYVALMEAMSKVHRSGILVDMEKMLAKSLAAISVLCQAWGANRLVKIDLPQKVAEELELPEYIPITEAIPGFYRGMLTARRGELVGVLPGRTEVHAKAMALDYFEQRRDTKDVTRADLAQGYTRYIQDLDIPARRAGEAAIGSWLVKNEPVTYVGA